MLGATLRRLPRLPTAGFVIAVVAWWLVIGGAVALTLPFAAVPGQAARIHQPGITWWPIPVSREGFDSFQLGVRESNESKMNEAFEASEWIEARHGQEVRIVAIDGDAIQIELLEGAFRGRRAWLLSRHLGPLP